MLANLETLVLLSELGTMQQVATRQRVSQSAVSKRIATLEAELGEVLCERSGRRVRLTPRAQELIERARPLLAELKQSLGEREQRNQRLSLGVSESVLGSFGPPLLSRAVSEVPGLSLALNAHRSPVAIDLVRSGEYALCLVAGDAGDLPDLLAEPLCEEAMVIVSGAQRPPRLRRGQELRLSTIEPHSATWRAISRPLASFARERSLTLSVDHTLQSFMALTQLALHGFFDALVPIGVARALGVPRDRLIRLPAPGLRRPVSLVGRKSAFHSPLIAQFARALGTAARELDLGEPS